MRIFSVLVLALLALLSPPAHAAVGPADRVVLMGDSEAYLLSWELLRLVSAAGASFKAVTVPGSSVISWGRELNASWAKVRAERPTVLLISLGANDACTGPRVVSNEAPFMRSFRAKLDKVRAKCVVWLGPPDIGAPNPTPSQCARSLAAPGLEMFAQLVQQQGITYFDARTITVEMWSDHLHCSRPQYFGDPAHGCKDWAAWAWNRLQTEDLCEGQTR